MKRIIAISLIAVLALGSTVSLAQSPYPGLYGAPSVGGLNKNAQSDALKLAIEMLLLYKLLGQPSMVATDGGVVVLFGSKILKYDKDLNMVKEVNLNLDVSSMQQMVSKVASSYTKEVMDSISSTMGSGMGPMGSGMGGLLQAKMSSNDALARATLRAISTAAESYSVANSGTFPTSISDLMKSTPPYINENYCEGTIAGFMYSCNFNATGYEISATPLRIGETGSKKYTITTGGVMKH